MRSTTFCLLLGGAAALVEDQSPVQKVVKLITEMKAQTIKEGEEDQAAYDKYNCWCETTESEKTDAIAAAQTKLQELGSFIEAATAKQGQLKTEIAGLEEDIASDKEALATATSLRNEENGKFQAEEADMTETIQLLTEAVEVLGNVQLMQKPQALVQVKKIVQRVSPKFGAVMQKDLFDMLGEFKGVDAARESTIATGSFLGQVFLPKTEAAALAQSSDPTSGGAAKGAKSYNSRSGGILGLLKAQHDEFSKKLATAQKEEAEALAAFGKLSGSKNAEIASATKQKNQKETQLSDSLDAAAKAKEDVEATTSALTADQKVLVEATESCATEDKLYVQRTSTRNEEIKALSETLNILTGDEARSLFDKTMNFLQTGSVSASQSSLQEQAKSKAMQRILTTYKKSKNWQLASLAVHVKLDGFTKVKAAMDKMLAELQSQQKAEYAKWETCKKDIDTTEDKIWNGKVEKRDLASAHKELENTLAQLDSDITELKKEVADAEVSLKQAGEERKAANQLFQTSHQDQQATIAILQMALKRLQAFYKPSFAQVHAHNAANPPPTPSGPEAVGYEKSASSGGVLQLLNMIIDDAHRTVDEMNADENQAQKDYANNVAATTASIEADREAIAEKEKQVASAKGDKSETEDSQLANQGALDKLNDLLQGLHNQCDYVIKYFDIRQQSRAEEMDAIKEAKAILSGSNFA